MLLENRIVMLTGAGGCIGRATALHLANEGANLVLCDVDTAALARVEASVRSAGRQVLSRAFDVRDYEAAQNAVQDALTTFGKIDALINIAGGSAELVNKISNFVDSDPDTWAFVMGINVQGSFNCARAVLPSMIKRQHGKIIFFGSIAGVAGLARRADYSAAKGALMSFTKALAMEVGQYNIHVNCISPGAIHRGDAATKGVTYLGSTGSSSGPEPVAKICCFLASEDSDFVTGQNIQVDGGRTLGALPWPDGR